MLGILVFRQWDFEKYREDLISFILNMVTYFTEVAKYGNWHSGCGKDYLFANFTVPQK